jgi:hypothetical protein
MNNMHFAPVYLRFTISFWFAELHSNIALMSLWMGDKLHEKM